MKRIRTWLTAVMLTAGAAQARADAFTADQLRLGETYRRGSDPIAAIAPLRNVIRRGRAAGEAEFAAAKLALADTYSLLGLDERAGPLLESLAADRSVTPAQLAEARLRMAVRGGEPRAILNALTTAQADTSSLPADLVFAAAAAVFAARTTDTSVGEVERLFGKDKRPEAVYLLGVCALIRGDAASAYVRFEQALNDIDRTKSREVFDAAALALGRLYYETGDYRRAEAHYATVSEHSALFDRVLYETAWVYVAEGDVTAAAGNLMRLAIDIPFSPLVPKSQVLYGFLMLRMGRFAQAERVFGAYVAHYSAMTETLGGLAAVSSDTALYEQVFADLSSAIAAGRNTHVEIMSWLAKNGRVAAANRLISKLQKTEDELAELTRVLREVQSVAEAGYTQEVTQKAAGDEAAAVRAELDAGLGDSAGRLSGRRLEALQRVDHELHEAQLMREGLLRLHRRILEKRREMVSLLQYADAARWSVWTDDGKLRAGPVTGPTAFAQGRAERGFARLDEGERRVLDTLTLVRRIENRALRTRYELLAAALPEHERSRQASLLAKWEKSSDAEAAREIGEVSSRLSRAKLARRQVDEHLKTMAALRAELLALSEAAVVERGRIAREELAQIDRAIGSLLVHARLGSADVAWEMRSYARARAAAVARSEQADTQRLRQFYETLSQPSGVPPSAPQAATGSTDQRIAALRRRAEADAAALQSAGDVLRKQAAASRALVERLRAGGTLSDWTPRVEAAGVLVLAPPVVPALHAVSSVIAVDGRLLRAESADVLVDDYLPPGMHQFDAVVHVKSDAGETVRLRGTLVVNLEAARGYRIRLRPAGTAQAPRLDLQVETEGPP